jgi:hypothetical protein
MQYVMRYDVEVKRSEEYRTWLLEKEQSFKESDRPGWEYLGTWFTVMGFGAYQAETRWEVDDYAALGAAMTDQGLERFKEWIGFIDQGRPIETYLMKSATDVIILPES